VLTPPDLLPEDMSTLQRAMLGDAVAAASRGVPAVYQ
jgi:hypothetical protein